MSAVQSGDGNEVHHAQHHRQQPEQIEELQPVPAAREGLPDGDEAAHRLVGLRAGRRHEAQVPQVIAEGGEGVFEARRDDREAVVFLGLDTRHHHIHADASQAVHRHADLHRLAFAVHRQEGLRTGLGGQQGLGVLRKDRFHAVHRRHPVAVPQVRGRILALGRDGIDDERDRQVEHPGCGKHLPDHRAVDPDLDGVRTAKDRGLADVPPGQVGLQRIETLRHIIVELQDAVARAEAHLVGQIVDIDGVALILDIGLAVDAQDAGEEDDGGNEVEQHAAEHHQQPLPGRMRPELPGLRFPFQALQVHGLVHHTGNLAVAAQGQPADAVFGFGLGGLREETSEPFRLLAAEDPGTLDIEEEEEFLHPDAEDLGKGEMAQLVQNNQHGQGQDDLQCLDQGYHINSPARAVTASWVAKISSSDGFAANSVPSRHLETTAEMS